MKLNLHCLHIVCMSFDKFPSWKCNFYDPENNSPDNFLPNVCNELNDQHRAGPHLMQLEIEEAVV